MSKQHSPGFLQLVDAARARIREVQASDLPRLLREQPDIVLVDVREESEFAAAHIQGAVHLGKGVIERDIEARYPDKDTPLYLYCGGGFRSALAADTLRQMGYTQALSIDGGWRELQALLPVEP